MNSKELETIFENLDEWGYIAFGKIIPKSVFETLFEKEMKGPNDMEFLGPLLTVKEYIEENGFMTTSKSMEIGSLRLIDANEYAYEMNNKIKNWKKNMNRSQNCFNKADTKELSKKEFDEFLHVSNKLCTMLHSMNSRLTNF